MMVGGELAAMRFLEENQVLVHAPEFLHENTAVRALDDLMPGMGSRVLRRFRIMLFDVVNAMRHRFWGAGGKRLGDHLREWQHGQKQDRTNGSLSGAH